MKKILLFSLIFTILQNLSFSQGIKISTTGTSTPDPSALLDVEAADKGILIPRIYLQDETDNTTISDPADGLLIYNTNSTAPMRKGFYFWSTDDNKWHFLYSGHVPSIPGNVEFWIRPDGANYIRPEKNANARVYDAGQNYSFYYEGTNKHGAFFAGDAVGVIGQRAGTDTNVVPQFIDDDFPFYDVNGDREITSDDQVTYTGLYAYGKFYVGVTGIAMWDAGVRGIGLGGSTQGEDGTNGTWPVTGVMGEVIDVGNPSDGGYGQQGVYGWQAAPSGNAEYCLGVFGSSAQTGQFSAGVGGVYTTDIRYPASGMVYWENVGFLGYGDLAAVAGFVKDANVYWAGYFGGDVYVNGTVNANGFVQNKKTSKGEKLLYYSSTTQNILEDFGTAKLQNGQAKIKINDEILEIAKIKGKNDYMVFITPTEEINNNIFVEKYDTYFIVKEANNGNSNITFDWRLVVKQPNIKNPKAGKKIETLERPNIKPKQVSKKEN